MSLPGSNGAQTPSASTSIVDATSESGLTWQITASITAQRLARAWAPDTAYTAGQAVVNQRRIYRCITPGTSAATGHGPTATGDDIADGTATWRGCGPLVNGLTVTNNDASIKVYWAINEDATTTIGDVLPTGGGGKAMSVSDPSRVSIVAASGTPNVTIAGLA